MKFGQIPPFRSIPSMDKPIPEVKKTEAIRDKKRRRRKTKEEGKGEKIDIST